MTTQAPILQRAIGTQIDGQHLMLTLKGCVQEVLDDEQSLKDAVLLAAQATGAQVLHCVSHRFTPHGVTAMALLAESHASLHTYPEAGIAFWDCFTCGGIDPGRSVTILVNALQPRSFSQQLIRRTAHAD